MSLILYGKGKLGRLAKEIFDELKISSVSMSQNEPLEIKSDDTVAVCVAVDSYTSIRNFIGARFNVQPVYELIELCPEANIHNGWFGNATPEELEQIVNIKWYDSASLYHYWSMISWRSARYEYEHKEYPITLHNRFLIPEVVKALKKGDVFSDGEKLYDQCPPDDGYTLKDLRNRQRLLDIKEPGNYLKLHLEGFELPSLKKSIEVISKARPILAVTAYHSRDGLVALQSFLMDNLDDYDFLFRLHAYMGQGAVIYGIPKERNR